MLDVGEAADKLVAATRSSSPNQRSWPPHNHTDQEEVYIFVRDTARWRCTRLRDALVRAQRPRRRHDHHPGAQLPPGLFAGESTEFIWCIAGARYWVATEKDSWRARVTRSRPDDDGARRGDRIADAAGVPAAAVVDPGDALLRHHDQLHRPSDAVVTAPRLREIFSLSNTQYGLIVSAFQMGMVVGEFPWLADGLARHPFGLTFAVAWWSVANAMHAAATRCSTSACSLLAGTGECGNFSGGNKVVAQWFRCASGRSPSASSTARR